MSHFYFFLIVAGISLLSWITGKLREQAVLKKAKDEARRRVDEQLRTGRSSAGDPTSQPSPQAELAARRQAQLQELRKQQQDRQRAAMAPGGGGLGGARPTPPVLVRNPNLPGYGLPRGGGAAPPSAPARGPVMTPVPYPQQQRQQKQRQETAQQREFQRRQQQMERQHAQAQAGGRQEAARRVRPSTAAALPASARGESPETSAAQPGGQVLNKGRGARTVLFGSENLRPTADDLRRAIILSEIMSPPVSMRDEE